MLFFCHELNWLTSTEAPVPRLQSGCVCNSCQLGNLVHVMFWLDQYSACLAFHGYKESKVPSCSNVYVYTALSDTLEFPCQHLHYMYCYIRMNCFYISFRISFKLLLYIFCISFELLLYIFWYTFIYLLLLYIFCLMNMCHLRPRPWRENCVLVDPWIHTL